MTACLHCRVSGRVQGVWFRASTREQAHRLGLTGYVKNLADGRVEVLACGRRGALESLQAWLWRGSEAAAVSEVECREIETAAPEVFTVV
ncbi:MAG: acylphosphatase [Gammaproteobacteria bacterium]|nr:acylphosphatase [Gammaproteobacteria bacterium]MCW8841604.1 acylphosphatase [Gammaproteobacteria bacterium]MCW8959242.1 acylphosphatase [Gammaproteobacteria bacterium]MCW8972229.1 acylphosphatase [Gammaproteobacteria bacterium]MCW8993730.1 acylphosphatase [Gammaproteobacteria bacterium]